MLKSQIWLIPKSRESKDFRDTRPINLIEVIRKIFTKILEGRLTQRIHHRCNERNFGFQFSTSTAEPITILRQIVGDSRAKKKSLSIILLDIMKAFDSVHFNSIKNALNSLKIDKNFTKLLENIFRNRKAQVLTREGRTEFFHPETGVEQGDPLSPKLWNIFYKPMLDKLEEMKGYNIQGINISYLAFADDIVLIAESDETMEKLLETV